MSPLASASPATRAVLILAGGQVALALILLGAAVVALIGLGRFPDDLRLERVPAWFWYYRHDPEVRR